MILLFYRACVSQCSITMLRFWQNFTKNLTFWCRCIKSVQTEQHSSLKDCTVNLREV